MPETGADEVGASVSQPGGDVGICGVPEGSFGREDAADVCGFEPENRRSEVQGENSDALTGVSVHFSSISQPGGVPMEKIFGEDAANITGFEPGRRRLGVRGEFSDDLIDVGCDFSGVSHARGRGVPLEEETFGREEAASMAGFEPATRCLGVRGEFSDALIDVSCDFGSVSQAGGGGVSMEGSFGREAAAVDIGGYEQGEFHDALVDVSCNFSCLSDDRFERKESCPELASSVGNFRFPADALIGQEPKGAEASEGGMDERDEADVVEGLGVPENILADLELHGCGFGAGKDLSCLIDEKWKDFNLVDEAAGFGSQIGDFGVGGGSLEASVECEMGDAHGCGGVVGKELELLIVAESEGTSVTDEKKDVPSGTDAKCESIESEPSTSSDSESESGSDDDSTGSGEDDGKGNSSSESDDAIKSSDDDDLEKSDIGVTSIGLEESYLLDDIDDDDGDTVKGPIKSRNEIEALPPVPKIDAQLDDHHHTLPVGTILSIMGERVVIEGSEKHSPLNEGSILWITGTREPLGLVDEIFGPVKNPYYVVRYNDSNEVPAGIGMGTAVSFVAEFADHILNLKDLQKKGYDASGENDEELMEEAEFSDDEKEAEYRKSLRQPKRSNESQERSMQSHQRSKGNYKADGRGMKSPMQPLPADKASNLHGNGGSPWAPPPMTTGLPLPVPMMGTNPLAAANAMVPFPAQMGGFVNPAQNLLLQQLAAAICWSQVPPFQGLNFGGMGTLPLQHQGLPCPPLLPGLPGWPGSNPSDPGFHFASGQQPPIQTPHQQPQGIQFSSNPRRPPSNGRTHRGRGARPFHNSRGRHHRRC